MNHRLLLLLILKVRVGTWNLLLVLPYSNYIGSNYHGNEITSVDRTMKDGSRLSISCPNPIKDNNKYMGGVDHADRLRALYNVDRKSKKWWLRIFWGLLDITFVNAYVIYCQMFEKRMYLISVDQFPLV